MSEPEDDADSAEEPQVHTCCPMRRKIMVGILKVFSEEECGISDSELADVMRFDLQSPTGKPVLAFRYCPWCGQPRDQAGESRVVDVRLGPFQDPDPT